MSDAADVLRAAKALIDSPEKWTKRAWARNAEGFVVGVSDATATCYCIGGALSAASLREGFVPEAGKTLMQATNVAWLPDFNDAPERTHAEVMAAFDRAIALAEEGAFL